jgi:hypothetical protein
MRVVTLPLTRVVKVPLTRVVKVPPTRVVTRSLTHEGPDDGSAALGTGDAECRMQGPY